MSALRAVRRSAYTALAAAMSLVIGCGDGVEPPPGLVGTWDATAIVVDGFDFIPGGMTLSYTLRSGGEYTYTVTNDQLGFCDPGPNCTVSGDFTATGAQITFDPGTIDEETFTYTVTGSTLTISTTFGGATFTFTFQKR